ncbi:hypothetical protein GF359_03170, partial [candidate division WOR-3 bacterium]|nr:hypothetical protein [candidate division WOR-3 bacterium]MBD3364196.1 hypothetical protein [candidate division WOR-3 bacterium]
MKLANLIMGSLAILLMGLPGFGYPQTEDTQTTDVSKLVETINEGDYLEQLRAANQLAEIEGSEAVRPLIETIKDGRFTHDLYETIKQVLVNIGDEAVPELLKYIDDDDSFVRGLAVYALGEIGADTAFAVLVDIALSTEFDTDRSN